MIANWLLSRVANLNPNTEAIPAPHLTEGGWGWLQLNGHKISEYKSSSLQSLSNITAFDTYAYP